jgi:hypothetical protein
MRETKIYTNTKQQIDVQNVSITNVKFYFVTS